MSNPAQPAHVLPDNNQNIQRNGNGDGEEENISFGVITPMTVEQQKKKQQRLQHVHNPNQNPISLPEEGEQEREEAKRLEFLRKNQPKKLGNEEL